MDTRKSGPKIKELIVKGCQISSTCILDAGIVTTPELHIKTILPNIDYPNYCSNKFVEFISESFEEEFSNKFSFVIDCANGCPSIPLKEILENLNGIGISDIIDITLINNSLGAELVNVNCGAEFVHKQNCLPNFPVNDLKSKVLASLDGDGDRLIVSYLDADNNLKIIDGDKIGTIFAEYISVLISKISNNQIKLGFVQTAYANSASTRYINMHLPNFTTVMTKTGVKNLHHEAKKFDIAIYFESNGHGTILFDENIINNFYKTLELNNGIDPSIKLTILEILQVYNLINQHVGDAITNLLLLIGIMIKTGLSIHDLDRYNNLPNRQVKLKVNNEDDYKTNHNDTRLLSHNELQNEIDRII